MSLRDVLAAAEGVQAVAEKNGMRVVSFEDSSVMAQADLTNGVDLGNRVLNPDGSIARSRATYAAVNLDSFYANRYRKIGKVLRVVVDYRAIKEQSSGRVYMKQIPYFEIVRDDKTGKLVMRKIGAVIDTEFINEYTHKLNREAMAEILPLITGGIDVTADDITI